VLFTPSWVFLIETAKSHFEPTLPFEIDQFYAIFLAIRTSDFAQRVLLFH
jgi:hypothetical protein